MKLYFYKKTDIDILCFYYYSGLKLATIIKECLSNFAEGKIVKYECELKNVDLDAIPEKATFSFAITDKASKELLSKIQPKKQNQFIKALLRHCISDISLYAFFVDYKNAVNENIETVIKETEEEKEEAVIKQIHEIKTRKTTQTQVKQEIKASITETVIPIKEDIKIEENVIEERINKEVLIQEEEQEKTKETQNINIVPIDIPSNTEGSSDHFDALLSMVENY